MLTTSSEQEKRYYVKSNFLNLKHYVCQIFLPSFKKDEEAAAILKKIVLAIFNTQQSKDDVKVTGGGWKIPLPHATIMENNL